MFKATFLVLGLLSTSQSFAFSQGGQFPCTKDNEVIAIMLTPIRPMGLVTDEDVSLAKQRCEAIGGQLGERIVQRGPPPGAV